MDVRLALKKGTTLRFGNGSEYTIAGELARGGSSIVYNAFYLDTLGEKKAVRIKECFPFKCSLQRGEKGILLVPPAEQGLFTETKQKMEQAYQFGNRLFATDGLTNKTANTFGIFQANHTLYIVSAYVQGQELSYQRYPTVKDSIAVVKSTADAICKIHKEGFLYLDLKPSNILTLEGSTELIQLFDFDSVVPISEVAEWADKISYTKGFAALELQSGENRQIGKHTDVYGIGALLFYMLFNRVPDAFDCEPDAEYDFSQSKLSSDNYRDVLAFRLTDFFHHTLADYYLDRFPDLEIVVEKLMELQTLADPSARYIASTKISTSGFFVGRRAEMEWLTRKLTGDAGGGFFVVGMGGIGKSTLVRRCLKQWEQQLDSILYVNYLDTIEKTICDDYAVSIHAVQKDGKETDKAYFERKLRVLRELGRDKNCVLILDNYTGDTSDAFQKLLQTGWKLLFVTRDQSLAEGYDTLEVGAIAEEMDLLALFSKNLGWELNDEERRSAASIICHVGGHTLVIELIAKQIGSQFCSLSLKQAAEIAAKKGFSSIATEKVGYQKDSIPYQDTIKQIISGLFAAEELQEAQRVMLKMLSLFGGNGVSVDQLCEMLGLETRDDLIALYQQGWIYVEDGKIAMHPVIKEVVSNWALSETALEAVKKALLHLDIKLKVEAQKEEYPKNLLRGLFWAHDVHEAAPNSWLDRKMQKLIGKKCPGMAEEAYRRRVQSYAEGTVTDCKEVRTCLQLAMAVLESGKREEKLYSLDLYKDLLYHTIQNTPYENECFIREKAEAFLALTDHNDERMRLKTYQKLLGVLYDRGEMAEAEQRLRQAKIAMTGSLRPELWGRYYYILAGYYDTILNGAYDARTAEEKRLVSQLLDTIEQAVRWLSISYVGDSRILLGECYRLKALVLIRSGIGKGKQIRLILEKVRKEIGRYAQPHSKLVRDYYMTLAWYHTYFDEDYEQTCANMSKAYAITCMISTSELEKIDDQFCPMANILLEWQQHEYAALYLIQSVLICSDYLESAVYARRQVDLLGHLLEVYFYAEEYDKCQAVIDKLDEKVEKINALDIADYVTQEMREAIVRGTHSGGGC